MTLDLGQAFTFDQLYLIKIMLFFLFSLDLRKLDHWSSFVLKMTPRKHCISSHRFYPGAKINQ